MKFSIFFFSFLISITSNAQVFDTLVLMREYSLLFESAKWELNEGMHEDLDSILSYAARADKIVLEGHTDKVGAQSYNLDLSVKRVNSIKEAMVSSGLEADKIQTEAFGELNPVKNGSSESSYQFNRRVSIRLYKNYKMRKLQGQVVDKESGEGLKAKIKLTGKNFTDSTSTQGDGKYAIAAPDKGIYKLEFFAENHFFEQRFIKISPLDPVEINVELPEIKIGEAYTLPNFNFKGDLPILLESSVPTLDLLYQLLSQSTLCVEIGGHINKPNEPDCTRDSKHYKLSVDRAEMVFNAMIKKGIFAERMLPKGYGNWRMLYPSASNAQEMRENRRVEIKFIDCKSEELLAKHSKD